MHLRQYLIKYGIKYSSFARQCNVSDQTIFSALSGKNINFSTAIKIVEISEGKVTYEDIAEYIKKHPVKTFVPLKIKKKQLRRIMK